MGGWVGGWGGRSDRWVRLNVKEKCGVSVCVEGEGGCEERRFFTFLVGKIVFLGGVKHGKESKIISWKFHWN